MEEFTAEWFDASSSAWTKNKKRIGQMYVYICDHPSCKRKVTSSLFCSKHEKFEALCVNSVPIQPIPAVGGLRRSPRLQQNERSKSRGN